MRAGLTAQVRAYEGGSFVILRAWQEYSRGLPSRPPLFQPPPRPPTIRPSLSLTLCTPASHELN